MHAASAFTCSIRSMSWIAGGGSGDFRLRARARSGVHAASAFTCSIRSSSRIARGVRGGGSALNCVHVLDLGMHAASAFTCSVRSTSWIAGGVERDDGRSRKSELGNAWSKYEISKQETKGVKQQTLQGETGNIISRTPNRDRQPERACRVLLNEHVHIS